MIAVDMQARFVHSHMDSELLTKAERRARTVTGYVMSVNYAHKIFTVEYNNEGIPLRECFHFADCGKTVDVGG